MKKNEICRIALVGYGSMGKELERLAPAKNCEVVAKYDIDRPLTAMANFDFDVAIDFSIPKAVVNNVELLAKREKNIVIGTTGWSTEKTAVERIVSAAGIGAVYGSNFSVGMQIFFRIVERAADLIDEVPDYDVMLHELHHRRKADAPSGTALSLADIILKNISRKKENLVETSHGIISPDKLHVTSTRGGEIAGTHTVYMDSAADTIELTHRAKNRSGFALGALSAARWIAGKKGLYDFREVFEEVMQEQ